MKLSKKNIIIFVLTLLTLFFALTAESCDGTSSTDTNPTAGTTQDAFVHCDPNASLACKEVQWRYGLFKNADQYGYFYGFVQGNPEPVVAYIVQGAVFPVDDLVNPPDKVTSCENATYPCAVVQQNQQPDGTWGTNGSAMFGKLADGQYFEWNGPYAFSFQKLTFQVSHTIGCPPNSKIDGCK